MAALTNPDRIAIWQKMMEAMSRANEPCSLTKTQLRAAIDAADDWADANAAAYNNALPAAARNNLTTKAAIDAADDWADANAAAYNNALPAAARNNLTTNQKARLLALVIMRRWEVG